MKFLPLTIAALLSIALVVYMVGVEKVDLSARLSGVESKQVAHYESTFRELSFKELSGEKIELKNLKAPVVLINFWASWCTPCLEEFPSLVELRNRFSEEEVKIFGVNSDEKDQAQKIKKTLEKYKLNFDIVPDSDSEILNRFMISAIPVTIIFVNGEVMEVSLGRRDFASEEFIQKIKSAL